MQKLIEIPVETLSEESFRLFGTVVATQRGATTWSRPGLDSWTLDFGLDGSPELKVVRYHYSAPAIDQEFSLLERHTAVTETRVPLAGSQGILVACPPTPIGKGRTIPEIEKMRAFHIDGSKGVMLAKGTWHALDCYPVNPPHADFLFITEVETEIEVEKLKDLSQARRTEIYDVSASGLRFRIIDPQRLCS